jgi:glycine/D-amino acid oxidase-like deaminating enzyme
MHSRAGAKARKEKPKIAGDISNSPICKHYPTTDTLPTPTICVDKHFNSALTIASMSTIILGGGIIGASIGYYLSANQSKGEIHIVEQSPELFTSASGYAAGFLVRDWFEPALAPLGAMSFDLHHELAAAHGGDKKWGFMKGIAFNLDTVAQRKRGGSRGDDWLRTGTSRAEAAAGSEDTAPVEFPEWLTMQKEGVLEKISHGETVAQA